MSERTEEREEDTKDGDRNVSTGAHSIWRWNSEPSTSFEWLHRFKEGQDDPSKVTSVMDTPQPVDMKYRS
jgi:hypothetical protein